MVNGREERICFGPTLSSALDNHPDGTQEDGEPLERGRKRKDGDGIPRLESFVWRSRAARPLAPQVCLRAGRQLDGQSRNMWNRLLDLEVILDGGRESIVCVRMWRVVRREP